MKKGIFVFIILSLFLNIDIFAQSERIGNKGLIFSLNNANMGNYEGGLGAKFYLSRDMAARLGLGLVLGKDVTTINLSPGVTFNMMVSKPITFYGGAELLIKSAGGDNAQNAGFQFGLGALAGAEWMIDKNVSLSGEYYLLSINMFSPKNGDTQTTIALGNYAKMLLTFYF